jgi:hypothetical protein
MGMILVPVGLWLFGGAAGLLVGVAVTVVGVMALASGLTGFCLLYVPFDISTTGPSRWARDAVGHCGCRCSEKRGAPVSVPSRSIDRRRDAGSVEA